MLLASDRQGHNVFESDLMKVTYRERRPAIEQRRSLPCRIQFHDSHGNPCGRNSESRDDNHVVDVRDCAAMHVAVMNNPDTNGHRHFSFGAVDKMIRMARVIDERFGALGFKTRSRQVPTPVMWVLSLFSTGVAGLYSKLGHPNVYEAKWPAVYRYQYTDFDAKQLHPWKACWSMGGSRRATANPVGDKTFYLDPQIRPSSPVQEQQTLCCGATNVLPRYSIFIPSLARLSIGLAQRNRINKLGGVPNAITS